MNFKKKCELRICLVSVIFFLFSFAFIANARFIEDPQIKGSQDMPLNLESLLLTVDKKDERVFVAGERGNILFSDDLGKSWINAHVPVTVTLTDLFFLNQEEGWAVGHDATILYTKDGGLNWDVQHFDPDIDQPLMSVIAYRSGDGLEAHIRAAGAYGYFLSSNDNGKTWDTKEISVEDAHLNQIIKIQNDALLMTGEFGFVYRSTSNDEWHVIKTPYEGSFFGVLEPKKDKYYVYGLRGSIYYSEDEGLSWKRITTNTTASLFGGIVLDDGRIVMVGSSGVLLLAEDSTNKRFNMHVFSDRKSNSDLIQLSEKEILIVGEGGIKRFNLSEIGG